ncbi:head completion/stabilization protein [Serratia bockelmannii]|uniref:head completion/stabilization protein n=1 Tax=Serratia bockelmannii TaxID=2703793 RepID=UPI003FA6F8F7
MNRLTSTPVLTGGTLGNSAFWPEIDTSKLRASVRLDGEVTPERLTHAAVEAMTRVNDELKAWKTIQQQLHHEALCDIPAETVNGQSVLVNRYLRAVYSTTKALLLEGYRDIDTTREGEKHAEALSTQVDAAWRDSQWAIRDIMGLPRNLAEIV